MKGTCKLCANEREIRKSHIIPDFHYGPLYDGAHRLNVLPSDGRHTRIPTGYYERLLCDDCEEKFSRWETYYKRILFDGGLDYHSSSERHMTLKGADVATVYLYHLSVLWRMSISRLPIFGAVSLGDFHEAEIRRLLLAEDGSRPEAYPVTLTAVLVDGEARPGWIHSPDWVRDGDGRRCYRFVLSGIAYHVLVSRDQSSLHSDLWRKTGDRITIFVEDVMNVPFLRDSLRNVAANLNRPKRR